MFKNFDTLPFLEILVNYKYLLDNGYNKKLLDENLHTWLSFPFFLFMMTAIAAVLTMNTLKKSDNIKFIMIGIILCITVFYLKDLSFYLEASYGKNIYEDNSNSIRFIFLGMKNNIKVKGKNNKIKLYELNNKFSPK